MRPQSRQLSPAHPVVGPRAGRCSPPDPHLVLHDTSAPGSRRLQLVAARPGPPPQRASCPARASDLPDPRRWAAHLARAAMDLLVGQRSPSQLAGWVTPAALAELEQGSPPVPDRGRVRSVRVAVVSATTVEAVVLIDLGSRTRAMAMRLRGLNMPVRPTPRHRPGPRWVATSLRLV